MKELDDGLAESISSLIWVTPRLQADVQELKIVSDQLALKYGRPYAQACLSNEVGSVSERLMHKMSVQAPPKVTVEKYLIEIAKYYNVEYQPDTQVWSLNSILSCWLFTVKGIQCSRVFCTNAQSRFASVVPDTILGPQRLAAHS